MVVKIVLTKCIELPNTLDNSIARTCIPANLRQEECENTKIPRAEVFPVLLFIIGLLSCFLQILFLFICHLSTSFYQGHINTQLYNRQANKLFRKPTWFKIVKVFWSLKSLTSSFAISCPSLKYDLLPSGQVEKLKWSILVVEVYIWICVLDHLKWN